MSNVFVDFNPKPKSEPPKPLVSITQSAKEYLRSVLVANEPEGPNDLVTLGVKGGGCSGFQYVWDFKSNWPDTDWSDPLENVLVLDPIAEIYVAGCTIDYVNELGGSYLKVVNPNVTSSCGCGESFAV